MPSVCVVVPSWAYWKDPLKLQPLWEMYYATFLQDRISGLTVELADLRVAGEGGGVASLPEHDVYFYWVMKSADALEVYDVVRALKAKYPKSLHFGGGNHVDRCTDEASAVFDVAFVGTAEELLVRAFGDLGTDRLQSVYRSVERFPFSDYGHARREYLPAERIVNDQHFSQYGGLPGTGVYFSRGCSFGCRFCVYNNPSKFEYRKPEQITAEIEYLKRTYGVEGVNLRDEVCVPVNPKTGLPYLEAIGKGGVSWRGQTVTIASEELVKQAADSGCKELALGLENVESDDVLRIINKPSKSVAANRQFIELLKKYGIRVKVCLIFGLPGETGAVVDRTIRFLEEVQPDYVAVSGFDPVPGSPIYENAEAYGIQWIDTDLSKHAHLVYRFGDDEDVGLPFEYADNTPWGRGRRRHEIVADIRTIQGYLRDRGMSY